MQAIRILKHGKTGAGNTAYNNTCECPECEYENHFDGRKLKEGVNVKMKCKSCQCVFEARQDIEVTAAPKKKIGPKRSWTHKKRGGDE